MQKESKNVCQTTISSMFENDLRKVFRVKRLLSRKVRISKTPLEIRPKKVTYFLPCPSLTCSSLPVPEVLLVIKVFVRRHAWVDNALTFSNSAAYPGNNTAWHLLTEQRKLISETFSAPLSNSLTQKIIVLAKASYKLWQMVSSTLSLIIEFLEKPLVMAKFTHFSTL